MEKIEWEDNPEGFPFFETDQLKYFLGNNTVFIRDEETEETTCYNCGSDIKARAVTRKSRDRVQRQYEYWCPTCEPKPQMIGYSGF